MYVWVYVRLQVCRLRAEGHVVVVVSSGAVGVGCVSLRLKKRPDKLNTKQALAAVGQCRLMRLYEDLFRSAFLFPCWPPLQPLTCIQDKVLLERLEYSRFPFPAVCTPAAEGIAGV